MIDLPLWVWIVGVYAVSLPIVRLGMRLEGWTRRDFIGGGCQLFLLFAVVCAPFCGLCYLLFVVGSLLAKSTLLVRPLWLVVVRLMVSGTTE